MGFYDWPWNSVYPRLAEWGLWVSHGKWPDQGKESQQDGRTRSLAEVWTYDHGAAGAGLQGLGSCS